MKRLFIVPLLLFALAGTAACSPDEAPASEAEHPGGPATPDEPGGTGKTLVAHLSAQGHTQAVAERIAALTGADIYRIAAAEPYAANPYDDSDRIRNEAYGDLRPGVAGLPDAAAVAQYDTVFVGSPCWWHQPEVGVYRPTPGAKHIPAALPEDLDPDDITTPGRPDDAGIDMPGNAGGTEAWLRRIGIIE